MNTLLAATLAYRPFIDPISLNEYWMWFLVPLALGIAVAYKAIRVETTREIPRAALVLATQIVMGVALLGLGCYLLIVHVLPRIVPM